MKKHRNKYPLIKQCVECGKEFIVNNGWEFRNTTCSLECGNIKAAKTRSGKGHWNWKGGTRISNKGYVYRLAPNHPYCINDGYVLEHRLVMENKIGISLFI